MADIDILCTVQYRDNIQYTVYNSIQQNSTRHKLKKLTSYNLEITESDQTKPVSTGAVLQIIQ